VEDAAAAADGVSGGISGGGRSPKSSDDHQKEETNIHLQPVVTHT